MAKAARVLLCVAALTVCVSQLAADAVSEQKKAQHKLLAYRAARADAIRKLAERINGLNLTSQTKVRDFVTESDTIRSAVTAYLSGMREVGRPQHSDDGVCEVKMEITLEEVIRALRRVHSKYYKGGKRFKTEHFEKMTTTNKVKTLTVTGTGAPAEEMEEDDLVEPDDDGYISFAKFGKKVHDFWRKNCTARGRLMAERAARLDAMRRLAERIKGLSIDSETTVQDFVAESDVINLNMKTFLRGAREIGVRYHSDELIVEVEMQVKIKQVFAEVHSWAKGHFKGDKAKLRSLEQKTISTQISIIKETGMGVPPARYLRKASREVREIVKAADEMRPWAMQTLKAVGNGAVDSENPNKAQAKLMAMRAAELDARRKLGERIQGLEISSKTSVSDFVAESDKIRTSMLTFQQGAYVVENSEKMSDDGIAEVTVAIELKPLWNMVIFYKKKGHAVK